MPARDCRLGRARRAPRRGRGAAARVGALPARLAGQARLGRGDCRPVPHHVGGRRLLAEQGDAPAADAAGREQRQLAVHGGLGLPGPVAVHDGRLLRLRGRHPRDRGLPRGAAAERRNLRRRGAGAVRLLDCHLPDSVLLALGEAGDRRRGGEDSTGHAGGQGRARRRPVGAHPRLGAGQGRVDVGGLLAPRGGLAARHVGGALGARVDAAQRAVRHDALRGARVWALLRLAAVRRVGQLWGGLPGGQLPRRGAPGAGRRRQVCLPRLAVADCRGRHRGAGGADRARARAPRAADSGAALLHAAVLGKHWRHRAGAVGRDGRSVPRVGGAAVAV